LPRTIILAQQLLPCLDGLEHHLFCSEAPVGIWQEQISSASKKRKRKKKVECRALLYFYFKTNGVYLLEEKTAASMIGVHSLHPCRTYRIVFFFK